MGREGTSQLEGEGPGLCGGEEEEGEGRIERGEQRRRLGALALAEGLVPRHHLREGRGVSD